MATEWIGQNVGVGVLLITIMMMIQNVKIESLLINYLIELKLGQIWKQES